MNVEGIAEYASLSLPAYVSPLAVGVDWRRKFFQEAENVCETDMQMLWGQVLAGEVAKPGSFGLRTLETLKQLSRTEAEYFRKLCSLAMHDGWVALLTNDINTSLQRFGIRFEVYLALQDAGLLFPGSGLHNSFPLPPGVDGPENHIEVWVNNEVQVQVSGPMLSNMQFPCLVLTQAGKELQRLIEAAPNEEYLAMLGTSFRRQGLTAKRGSSLQQSSTTSIVVFEKDL